MKGRGTKRERERVTERESESRVEEDLRTGRAGEMEPTEIKEGEVWRVKGIKLVPIDQWKERMESSHLTSTRNSMTLVTVWCFGPDCQPGAEVTSSASPVSSFGNMLAEGSSADQESDTHVTWLRKEKQLGSCRPSSGTCTWLALL